MEFVIPPDAIPRSYRSRFFFDIYEAPERELVKEFIRPGSTVLELGGCIGVVSCTANRLLEDPTRHVVVEANPALIDTLKQNRDRNRCGFHIEQGVVGIGSTITFHVSPLMTASRIGDRLGRAVTVPVRSIHSLQDAYDLQFDTLIADIEGGELSLLEAHRDVLPQFRTLILEVHPGIIGEDGARRVHELLIGSGLRRDAEMGGTSVWLR